jgi:peptidyl-prolyl cis-trans isomerase C
MRPSLQQGDDMQTRWCYREHKRSTLERKEVHLKKFIPLAFIVFFLISGCSKSDDGKGFLSNLGFKGSKNDSHMVARVGDDVITDRQIEQFIGQLPPQVSAHYSPREIRKEIAEGFLNMKILAWEAKRRGIDKREDVQLKIATLQEQALAREVEEELKKNIKVDESEIKKYYDEHKDRYSPSPRIHARQITVASETDAKTVLAKLGKGADFAQTAQQLSKDANASKGGDMGWMVQGSMDPALEKVAWGLKEGQLSPVIKTQQGFSIIKVENIIPGRDRPYDQVKSSIERMVMRDKLNKAVEDLKTDIKRKAKVEVNQKYFAQFKETVPQAMPGMAPMTPGPKPAGSGAK